MDFFLRSVRLRMVKKIKRAFRRTMNGQLTTLIVVEMTRCKYMVWVKYLSFQTWGCRRGQASVMFVDGMAYKISCTEIAV